MDQPRIIDQHPQDVALIAHLVVESISKRDIRNCRQILSCSPNSLLLNTNNNIPGLLALDFRQRLVVRRIPIILENLSDAGFGTILSKEVDV